jgi:hypothetical protein
MISRRSALTSSKDSTVWLMNLIYTLEEVGSSTTPCDPSVTRAFWQRLRLPGLLPPRATLFRKSLALGGYTHQSNRTFS